MMIECDMPAPDAKARKLHDHLVDAGQALSASELRTFVLTITDDEGRMTAGCKGEIAFKSAYNSQRWIAETHRGHGVGRDLLGEAEQLALKNDCVRLHLETRNEDARRLYERMGYVVFGRLPNYDGKVPFYYLEKWID